MNDCDHEPIFKKWCGICDVIYCERCAELYEPFEGTHDGYRECQNCKEYLCTARFVFDDDVCCTCQLRADIELLSQKFNQALTPKPKLQVIKTQVAYRYDYHGRPVAYDIDGRLVLRTHPMYCYSTTLNHWGRVYDYVEQAAAEGFKCRCYGLEDIIGENLEQILQRLDNREFIKFIAPETSDYKVCPDRICGEAANSKEYIYITPCDLDYEKFAVEMEYDVVQEHELGIIEYRGQVWKIFTSEFSIPATTIIQNASRFELDGESSGEYTELEGLQEFVSSELKSVQSTDFKGNVYRGHKIVGYVFSHPFRETLIAYLDGDTVPSADPASTVDTEF